MTLILGVGCAGLNQCGQLQASTLMLGVVARALDFVLELGHSAKKMNFSWRN